jgi:hypothetical protein
MIGADLGQMRPRAVHGLGMFVSHARRALEIDTGLRMHSGALGPATHAGHEALWHLANPVLGELGRAVGGQGRGQLVVGGQHRAGVVGQVGGGVVRGCRG